MNSINSTILQNLIDAVQTELVSTPTSGEIRLWDSGLGDGDYVSCAIASSDASDGSNLIINGAADSTFSYHQLGGDLTVDRWGVYGNIGGGVVQLCEVNLDSSIVIPELHQVVFNNNGQSGTPSDTDADFVINLVNYA